MSASMIGCGAVGRWCGVKTKLKGRSSRAHEAALTAALCEKTPDVVGGSVCITRTRIPIWTLEQYRRLGSE